MKQCWLVLWSLLLMPVAAATEHLNDHEAFCQSSARQDCLALLQEQLTSAKPYSVRWYQLKAYQLDYLFDKHLDQQLAQQTQQLLQLEDVPPVFRTQLYFYQAKILHSNGQLLQAQHYAELASADLTQLFQAFADPLRLVELANLQTVMGQQEQAWQLLQQAEARFARSKDPVFMFELYTNKALVQQAKGQLADAAYSRKLALDAILPSGDQGKISVAYGNLGRTYQLLGQYGLAQQYYQLALQWLVPGADDVRRQMRLLRLSQLHCQLQDLSGARQLLAEVNPQLVESSYQPLYQHLQQQLVPGTTVVQCDAD
jgi:tetratricopeptide (TPR) repeat protein